MSLSFGNSTLRLESKAENANQKKILRSKNSLYLNKKLNIGQEETSKTKQVEMKKNSLQ